MSGVLAVRTRRALAGLLVLALLVLSFSQTFAVSTQSLVAPVDLRTAMTMSGHFGSPAARDNCVDCPNCCISGGCVMLSGYLPPTVTAPMPVMLAVLTKPGVAVPAPDGLGHAPALPPPRGTV